MNKKKAILLVVLSFVMLFTLTGCAPKSALTADDFISKAQSHNYVISDATSQFESYGIVESATIAQSSTDWQVEFYVLTDESEAISMYNANKSKFESYKENTSSESSVTISNYSSYTLTSGGYYMHICRVDNTLLYVRVETAYKDTVKDFIKELGY